MGFMHPSPVSPLVAAYKFIVQYYYQEFDIHTNVLHSSFSFDMYICAINITVKIQSYSITAKISLVSL